MNSQFFGTLGDLRILADQFSHTGQPPGSASASAKFTINSGTRREVAARAGPAAGRGGARRSTSAATAAYSGRGRGHGASAAALGSRSLRRRRAFTATRTLEPDMDRAAISGRSASPNAGSKTPAAIGSATEL